MGPVAVTRSLAVHASGIPVTVITHYNREVDGKPFRTHEGVRDMVF